MASAHSSSESILDRWRRLDAMMEAARAVAALREAVQALEVIAQMPGDAGAMAGQAIVRVEAELAADVALEQGQNDEEARDRG